MLRLYISFRVDVKPNCYLSVISEEGILRDTERVEDGIRTVDSPKIVTNASNIARRANRVLQVAQQEAENSEDAAFVDNVNHASEQLKASKKVVGLGLQKKAEYYIYPKY